MVVVDRKENDMKTRTLLTVLLASGLLLGATLVLASPAPPAAPQSPQPQMPLTKPAGIDLDVTHISRTPRYHRYDVMYTPQNTPFLRPGTEGDQRWPAHGETVTFTAHIANKGTVASGPFDFVWRIDGADVLSGTHPGLAPGTTMTETYAWVWAHTLDGERLLGEHTVTFAVDPNDAIVETYKSNNTLTDRTDALALVLALTQELYDAMETPVDPVWPFSAEDWLQKQIAAMNVAFAASAYASALQGATQRVRLDDILITSEWPPTDFSIDGCFWMSADDRYGNAYYHAETDVSGALIHELGHQLGLIDLYVLDVALEIPQVLDGQGKPVQMEFWSGFDGLMSNPGIYPIRFAEHTTLALNSNLGYRRGYYGEYLFDVPLTTTVRVLDNQGNPAPGVTLRFFQRASGPNVKGSLHGVIDAVPEITVTAGADGMAVLPNRDAGPPVTTNTGHTLRDNPFGVIDVVGRNDEFLVGITTATHEEFQWLTITDFNLTAWRGADVLTLTTHVPPPGASQGVGQLHGKQAFGNVKLTWESAPGAVAYNVYQTGGPVYTLQRVVTGVTALEVTLPYDFNHRAAGYAVTAVDAAGLESGFSNLYWALRLQNPSGVLLLDDGNRFVLDPQNGYALLLQSPDGDYFDTLGSFDVHLEYSQYLAWDPFGQVLVSHPTDAYSSRHSVRILDIEGRQLFEFGETGSAPGQLLNPAGIATWPSLDTDPFDFAQARTLVADSGNDRLQAFTLGGSFVTAYADLDDPRGVAVLSDDVVVVVDRGNARLRLLNFDGETFTHLRDITAAFIAPTHVTAYGPYLIVTDEATHNLTILHRDGTLVDIYTGPDEDDGGLFYQPRGVAVDNAGRMIIADAENRRVVMLSGALPALSSLEVTLTGPYIGYNDVPYTFTASVAPLTALLPLTFTWEAAGQTTVVRTIAANTDTMSYAWPTTGTYGITVTAAAVGESAQAWHKIVINPENRVYVPLALRGSPSGPRINAFHADVEIADPGQTILLTWTSQGAISGTLYWLLPTGQFGSYWSVAPNGSMPYAIPETWRNFEHFMLYVNDAEGRTDSAYLNIPLTCPDTWFFEPAPDDCPASPPLYSAGAQQLFEHGVMLWVGEEDRIYVIYDDGGVGAWSAFTDEWNEGDPIDDPSIVPPEGFYQPVRGFGLVWREQLNVRERLGWATALEQGYETAVQRTSRWKYNDTYIRALDGGTWRLGPEGGSWEYLPAP